MFSLLFPRFAFTVKVKASQSSTGLLTQDLNKLILRTAAQSSGFAHWPHACSDVCSRWRDGGLGEGAISLQKTAEPCTDC